MPKRKQSAVVGDFSEREILFIYHYCANSSNGAAAAVKAGYSEKTAKNIACQMLADPRIKAEIDKVLGRSLAKLEITVERVLSEIAKLAFFDIRKCFKADGSLKPIHELDDDTAAALAGMDVIDLQQVEGESRALLKKFKISDKKGALELLGKHLKMWTDKIEVTDDRPKVVIRDLTGKKKAAGNE